MATALQLPAPAAFDPSGDPTGIAQRWVKWKTSFTYFISACGITQDAQKRNCLLHLLGPACQEIFSTFTETGTTLAQALTKFDEHFAVSQNVPYERHKFHQCSQKKTESIDQFVIRLRKLAATCDFGEEQDNMIRDMVIAKTTSSELHKRLLMEPELTFKKTLDLARVIESAVHSG